jgi:hypothetical protein
MKLLYAPFVEKISQLKHETQCLDANTSLLILKKAYLLNRLECLTYIFKNEDIEDHLQEFFAAHFEQFHQTMFFYTVDVTHPFNKLLLEIASIFPHPFSVVCPNVSSISCMEGFADFDENTDLTVLFQTHIMGGQGRYLIPIQLLSIIDIAASRFPNPYFDYDVHPESAAYLNTEELHRLQYYHAQTQAWFEIRAQHQQLVNDKSHLLGILQELMAQMFFNSAHGGIGHAENAGSGVYAAIIRFNDYFNKIHVDDVARIPAPVLQQIKTLLSLSSDAAENSNATQEIKTCIGTQRENLLEQVQRYQDELMHIGLDSAEKAKLLSSIRQEFEQANTLLVCSSAQVGSDKLKLPVHFFETLDIQLSFMHLEDVSNFLMHTVEFFPEIIQRQQLSHQILDFFLDFEHWVEFNLDLPIHLLRPFLKALGPKLFRYLVHQSAAIGIWLSLCNMDYFKVIMAELHEPIANFIDNVEGFCRILMLLKNEQHNYFFDQYFDQMVAKMEDISQLVVLMSILQKEQQMRLYDAILPKMDAMLHNGQDFARLLQILPHQKQQPLLLRYLPKLQLFIFCAVDVEAVFNVLPLSCKQGFIEHMLQINRLFIHSAYDFGKFMEILNESQRHVLWQEWRDELGLLISDGVGFSHVIQHLTNSLDDLWATGILAKLPLIIEDGYDFNSAMRYLPEPMREVLFENCLDLLPKLIINGSDFSCAMYYLNSVQQIQLADACKRQLHFWIEGHTDLIEIFGYLNLSQAEELLLQLQPNMHQWIRKVDDYGSIIYGLPATHVDMFFKHTMSILMRIIRSCDDLIQICEIMDKPQLNIFMSLHWQTILSFRFSHYRLCQILKYLAHPQREILLLSLLTHSNYQIESLEQMIDIFSYLLPSQKERFIIHHFSLIVTLSNQADSVFLMLPHLNIRLQMRYINLLFKMPSLLFNALTHWLKLFERLHPAVQRWVYQHHQAKIVSLISNSQQFCQMMQYLNAELKPLFFAQIITKIPDMVFDVKDYGLVMQQLEKAQRVELYDRLKPQAKRIMSSIFDMKCVMQLTPRCCHADFLLFIQSELKQMIQTTEDLCFFMLELSTYQKDFLLILKQSDLKSMVNSLEDLALLLPFLSAAQIDWLFKNIIISIEMETIKASQIQHLFEYLSFYQSKQLIECFGSVLQYRLSQPNLFMQLMISLQPNSIEYLATCMFDRYPDLFWIPSLIPQTLDILSKQQCLKLFVAVGVNFEKIFRLTSLLIDFIHHLPAHQQIKFIQYFQDKITTQIQSPVLFCYWFSNLDANSVKSIRHYTQQYPEINQYIEKEEVKQLLNHFFLKETSAKDSHQPDMPQRRL